MRHRRRWRRRKDVPAHLVHDERVPGGARRPPRLALPPRAPRDRRPAHRACPTTFCAEIPLSCYHCSEFGAGGRDVVQAPGGGREGRGGDHGGPDRPLPRGGHPVRRPGLPARGLEPLRGRRQRRRLVALRAVRRAERRAARRERPRGRPRAHAAAAAGRPPPRAVRGLRPGAPRPRGGHAAVGLAAAGRPARRRHGPHERRAVGGLPGRAARGRHPPGRRRQLLVRLRAVHPGRGGAGDAQELRRHARVQPRGRLQAAALPRGRVAHAARGRPAAVQRPRDARLRPRPRGPSPRRPDPTARFRRRSRRRGGRSGRRSSRRPRPSSTARTRRWRAAPSPRPSTR